MAKKNETPSPAERITLKIEVERLYSVNLYTDADGNAVNVTRDMAELDARALAHVFGYGVGRFNRDGTTKVREKVDGKSVERDATNEERIELADAKWSRLIEDRMREHTTSGDALMPHLRVVTLNFLLKQGVAKKALPKLANRDAVKAVFAAHDGSDGLFNRAVAKATAIAAEMKADL